MPDEGEDEGVGDGAGEPRALGVEVLRSLVQAASRHLQPFRLINSEAIPWILG